MPLWKKLLNTVLGTTSTELKNVHRFNTLLMEITTGVEKSTIARRMSRELTVSVPKMSAGVTNQASSRAMVSDPTS